MVFKRLTRKAAAPRRIALRKLVLWLAVCCIVCWFPWYCRLDASSPRSGTKELHFSHVNLTLSRNTTNTTTADLESAQCQQPHPLQTSAAIFQRTRTVFRTTKCGSSHCHLPRHGPRVVAQHLQSKGKWRFNFATKQQDDTSLDDNNSLCPSFVVPDDPLDSTLGVVSATRVHQAWGQSVRESLGGKVGDRATLFVRRSLCPNGVATVTAYSELMPHSFPKSRSWTDQGRIEALFLSGDIWGTVTHRQVWLLSANSSSQGIQQVGSIGWLLTVPYPNIFVSCGAVAPRGTDAIKQDAMFFVHPLIRDDRLERWRAKVSYRSRQAQQRKVSRPLHVLLVMWDSVSMAMFDERARKTAGVLHHATKVRKSHDLFETKRLNTIGCCSPHNQGAWLAGFPSGKSPSCISQEAPVDCEVWLWNEADKLNFTTFYAYEGCPTTNDHDFQVQLTADATLVGFGCAGGGPCLAGTLTKARMTARSARLFWNEHARQLRNNITGELVASERLFGWLHFISTHEASGSLLHWVDEETAPEMQDMFASGVLDDTAVVLWSDHGLGFGEHYGTTIGEYERNNPFAKILLPRWFVEAEPKATSVLRSNMDRLLTPFDMHEMLRTLLRYGEDGDPVSAALTAPDWPKRSFAEVPTSNASDRFEIERCWLPPRNRPQNPLLEVIEESRSCAQANIPLQYCNCIVWRDGNKLSTLAVALSRFVEAKHRAVVADVEAKLGPGRCNEVNVASVEQLHYALAEGKVGISYEVVANHAQFRVLILLPPELLHDAVRRESALKSTAATELLALLESHSTVLTMERTTPMAVKCGVEAGIAEHMCDCFTSGRDEVLEAVAA